MKHLKSRIVALIHDYLNAPKARIHGVFHRRLVITVPEEATVAVSLKSLEKKDLITEILGRSVIEDDGINADPKVHYAVKINDTLIEMASQAESFRLWEALTREGFDAGLTMHCALRIDGKFVEVASYEEACKVQAALAGEGVESDPKADYAVRINNHFIQVRSLDEAHKLLAAIERALNPGFARRFAKLGLLVICAWLFVTAATIDYDKHEYQSLAEADAAAMPSTYPSFLPSAANGATAEELNAMQVQSAPAATSKDPVLGGVGLDDPLAK